MKKKFTALRERKVRGPHRPPSPDRELPQLFGRVLRPTGWGGGYNRKPPQGAHKCLSRSEMVALVASLA